MDGGGSFGGSRRWRSTGGAVLWWSALSGGIGQGLIVGIAKYESHIVNTFFEHVINSVTAATSNSYYFDNLW
jgi:hypothetical protein